MKYNIFSDFNWLHLSDFHTGSDFYEQDKTFKKLLKEIQNHIQKRGAPNMVFITGDLANNGNKEEYLQFDDSFLTPLIEILGIDYTDKIFIVPGNHDVERKKAIAVKRKNALGEHPTFLDPTPDGYSIREPLLKRFHNFSEYPWPLEVDDWVRSDLGYFTSSINIANNRTIGVLGINTSWFCDESNDHLMLSPGMNIVETGLDSLSNCDKIIVLGHHPLSWLIPSEAEKINALFSQNQVIYLHGHLHKTKQSIVFASSATYSSIQAGCVFDTRNSEEWTSRIIWGAFNFSEMSLFLEPRKWRVNLNEWGMDSDYISETYDSPENGIWKIPTVYKPVTNENQRKSRPNWLSEGWEIIDEAFIKQRNKPISKETLLQYFEGRLPTWSDILSGEIPQREIVKELTNIIIEGYNNKESQLVLLLGAGGEGKSTAFLQTVLNIHNSTGAKILWRHDPGKQLPIEMIKWLTQSDERWIIASDEGDSLIYCVQKLLKDTINNKNIQVLLASRDTDWREKKGHDVLWSQFCGLNQRNLKGLIYEDAKDIVNAWAKLGERGLGNLANIATDQAIENLLNAAQEEAIDSQGAFLGAMLRVRIGDALKDHVADLMARLDGVKISSGRSDRTLLDALVYISTPHAYNIQYLSRSILAEAFNMEESAIRRDILKPLGEEAAAEATGDFILIRHRAIAEAVITISEDRFDFDVENILCELVSSAINANKNGASVPHLTDWRYLSTKFYDEGNSSFAIRLAKSALINDSKNSFLLVKLAQLYRQGGQAEQSLKVFRTAGIFQDSNRGYFTEWASNEASVGNNSMSALLNALSISDNIGADFPKIRDIGYALVGCYSAFIRLYEDFNRPEFACGAIATYIAAKTINLDKRSYDILESRAEEIERMKTVFKLIPQDIFNSIYRALKTSFEQRELDQTLDLPKPEDMKFTAFETLVQAQKFVM